MGQINRRIASSRGFTMIEVTLALALTAIIGTVYQSYQVTAAAEDALAQGIGEHLLRGQSGLVEYQRRYFAELSAGNPIPGFVTPLQPTVAEMKTASILPSTFRDVTASNQSIKIAVRRDGCPGLGCQLSGLVYVDGPLQLPRTGATARIDLASTVVAAMRGAGAVSYFDNPSKVRGPAGMYDNPKGSTVGVVGALTYLNTALYNSFVRINDTRDPNLAGNLTVAGNGAFGGNVAVTGDASATNVIASGDVRARNEVSVSDAAACKRASLNAAGLVEVRNAACSVVASINSAGRVTLGDGATNRVVLDGATGAITLASNAGVGVLGLSQTAGGGLVDVKNAAGTTTASLDGSKGLLSASRASLSSTGTEGAACGAGVADGEFVADANAQGTILMCRGGLWVRPGLITGTVGGACGAAAKIGQAADGTALICRGGTWITMNDRMTRQVQIGRFSVVNNTVVAKPSCGSGGSASVVVTPVDVVIDYSGAPPRNRYVASATDMGASWSMVLRLLDGTGAQFTSSFGGVAYGLQGIATTFCDYAL